MSQNVRGQKLPTTAMTAHGNMTAKAKSCARGKSQKLGASLWPLKVKYTELQNTSADTRANATRAQPANGKQNISTTDKEWFCIPF